MSYDKVQELWDMEQIRQTKGRYFRLLDAKDWTAFRQLFTDDARFDLMGADPIEGADAIVAFVSEQLVGTTTAHNGHMPLVELISPTEARASTIMYDYVEWPNNPESGERQGIEGYGCYEETYKKVDGTWRIARWRLSYAKMDPLYPQPLPAEVLGGPQLLREGEYAAATTRAAR
jgi:hypothetical protein